MKQLTQEFFNNLDEETYIEYAYQYVMPWEESILDYAIKAYGRNKETIDTFLYVQFGFRDLYQCYLDYLKNYCD